MDNNPCIRLFADHEQINNCKGKLKTAQKSFYQLSNILALAGNEVRLKIVYLLEEEKELCRFSKRPCYFRFYFLWLAHIPGLEN